jgi:creatinine amidohydrolase
MLAEQMTWMEYRDKVKQSVVILPMGAFEQHGPHLPLNVDVIIPTNFAKLVADKIDAMVLPPVTYGYKSQPTSGGGPLFPGTTSLDGETLSLTY